MGKGLVDELLEHYALGCRVLLGMAEAKFIK